VLIWSGHKLVRLTLWIPVRFCTALVLLNGGCADSNRTAPIIHATPNLADTCTTAWSTRKARSVQSTLTPIRGGYRRIDPAMRDELKARIESKVHHLGANTGAIHGDTFEALGAAIHDWSNELHACMVSAEPAVQDAQYLVDVRLLGAPPLSSIVDSVVVRRLDHVAPTGEPITVTTPAESCIRDLLLGLELPPGGGPAEFRTIVRSEDCR
jgi:hypothetical protein